MKGGIKDPTDEFQIMLALAGVALHGMLSNSAPNPTIHLEDYPKHAFTLADGMLREFRERAEARGVKL